ncbi:Uncharacterized protein TPAR_00179 [Tolypocladium paradoxum]|uniref:Uncharacterized protein n=1 Tax=Tolypocladium paradoxum TaxID=94208 RepID=A0A2S4LB29_9HYPO|nr:Uncharacterized protein TPAR_00179 [Tolypocladium paradoxum]
MWSNRRRALGLPRQYATGWKTSTNRPEQGLTPWRDLQPWPDVFECDGDDDDDNLIQASPPRRSNDAPQSGERLGQVVDANFNRPRVAKRLPRLLRLGSEIKSARNMDLSSASALKSAGHGVFQVCRDAAPDVPVPDLPPPQDGQQAPRRRQVPSRPDAAFGGGRTGLRDDGAVPHARRHEVTELLQVPRRRPQPAAALELDNGEESSGSRRDLPHMSVDELADEMVKWCSDTGTSKLFPPTPDQLIKMKTDGDDSIYKTPPFRQIPDHCPVRHRNAIIHLLILIEGRDVPIDSASQVCTLVVLAKIFDSPSVVLPEEALRIGFALEIPQVTQCAFRILVNEMALSEAATDDAKREVSRMTVFGRRLGKCGDELNNLIQHAARALVERLRRLELLLTTGDESVCRAALEKLRQLMKALPDAVASKFNDAAREHINDARPMLWSIAMDRATYVLPQDFEKLSDILCNENLVQKLLCPFTYNDLGERCSWALYLGLPRPAMVCTDEWAEFLDTLKDCNGSLKYHAVKLPLVDLDRLEWEVKDVLRPLTLSWIRYDIDPPPNITRHMLLTLTINEMKFLPLWAGGFDDGTGGVFESFVPPTDMGPNGPGPAYHTGRTLPSAPPSISDSMIEDMSAMRLKGSTTAGSIDVHDAVYTVSRPDTVIADDVSVMSDAFTANTAAYHEAKFAVPAEHQGVGQAVDADFESVTADGLMTWGGPLAT